MSADAAIAGRNGFPMQSTSGIMKQKTVVLAYVSRSPDEINPAIYYLAEHAQKAHSAVRFVTLTFPKDASVRHIVDRIRREDPVFAGCSAYLWNREKTIRIARALRKSGIPVVLGGPEASYNAKAIMETEQDVDIVVTGEGEETLVDLVRHYVEKKKELRDIKGLWYRESGSVKGTGDRSALDLAKVASPFLGGRIREMDGKTVTYETSRGCPFKCAYCSYNFGSYAGLRFFPLERVKRELTRILKAGPKKVNIVDDNFNIYESRSLAILKNIRRSIGRATVTLFLRADVWKISEQLARSLAHKNVYCTIGVQSLNSVTLDIAKRTNNRENLEYNLNLLKKHNVRFILQFIIGLPGDRYKDVCAMIDWACRFDASEIHLQTLRINPQTLYEKHAKKFGIAYRKTPPYTISRTADMTARELVKSQILASRFEALYRDTKTRQKLMKISKKTNISVSKLIELSSKDSKRDIS
jgi:anaerobic magnesium-protoporphyrin IX monomethyl ester cyclase